MFCLGNMGRSTYMKNRSRRYYIEVRLYIFCLVVAHARLELDVIRDVDA